jgi:hypothetical protein
MKIVKVQVEARGGKLRDSYINVGQGNLVKANVLGNGTLQLEMAELSGSRAVVNLMQDGDVERVISVLESMRIDNSKELSQIKNTTQHEDSQKITNYNGISGLTYYKKLNRFKKEGKRGFLSKEEADKLLNESNK